MRYDGYNPLRREDLLARGPLYYSTLLRTSWREDHFWREDLLAGVSLSQFREPSSGVGCFLCWLAVRGVVPNYESVHMGSDLEVGHSQLIWSMVS